MKTLSENNSMGALVRQRRKAEGMTQAQLAATAGVGVRFVRELEADKPTLRIDKINQVLWLFGWQAGVVPLPEDPQTLDDAEG